MIEEIRTLKEANYNVERWDNKLNKLLREKEQLESMVMPQAIDTTKISVDGGKRVDKLPIYIQIKELKDLDNKIVNLQEKIKNEMDWIDNELKILKKYDKTEELIVHYKENEIKKYTWASISRLVHYSESQCKRIYRKYKKKRNI
ncbi:MAG: hypothetical protein J6B89_03515 [Bacilli bacterium]|nr:hypothetical protein [Bacilli bacterium]